MTVVRRLFLTLCACLALAVAVRADGLSALARLEPSGASITDAADGIAFELHISQPVPYRVRFLDGPPRLVVDFREVDFGSGAPEGIDRSNHVQSVAAGRFVPGWSRLVAELDGPAALASATETKDADGTARISLRLRPQTQAAFAQQVAADAAGAVPLDWDLPAPAVVGPPIRRQDGSAPLKVVLDPGHGGIDPGALADGKTEADTVLAFTLDLAEKLRRAGMIVTLTRESDLFVPLEQRISAAHKAQADVFLSLHADAVPEGIATGATIYKLSKDASDEAAQQLAERHNRADILAGVDLSQSDDEVADVLMDLARQETAPRADKLAAALVDAIKARDLKMHRHPLQEASFAVLKSADIPSLLLELGFLSSARDRKRLADPVWRAAMEEAILSALQTWAVADAADAQALRQ